MCRRTTKSWRTCSRTSSNSGFRRAEFEPRHGRGQPCDPGESPPSPEGLGLHDLLGRDPNASDARGAFYVKCFPKSLQAFVERFEELRGNPEQVAIMEAEVKSGQLAVPRVAMRYTLRGAEAEGGVPLGVLHIPFATAADAEEMGFSTTPDNFRPWLMWEGSPMAHVMFPGN